VAYLPTGQLVFFRGNQLMHAPFELARTALAAPASPILSEVDRDLVAFSGTGLVALLQYPLGIRRTIVLVDRSGAHAPLIRESESLRWPRLSPDGRRLAVGRRASLSQSDQVWVFDLQTGGHIQLHDDGADTEPVWTPDGKRIIYSSTREANVDLYWQPADGSGKSEMLSSLPWEEWPSAVSPDGRLVALYGQSKANEYGIWTVTLDGAAKATQIMSSPSHLKGARFDPSGRWIAYSTDETGRSEVYVCPFPSLHAKWAVSTDGGTSPVWSPNGRELFYRSGSRMMMAEVTTTPTFSARPARVLFEGRFDLDLYGDIDYDVMPDGQQFVMMLVEPAAQPRLRVMTNWVPEDAKR
jgi:Tol biopolymer transport system component